MSVLPVGFGSAVNGGFQIERSLRFNKPDSAYLNKTFGANPTSRTTMTMSVWLKRGKLSDANPMFIYGTVNNYESASFNSSDQLVVTGPYMSAQQGSITTAQVFRDPSSWYHFVFVYDTTNATASDRIRLYVNGTRVTTFSSSTNSNQNNTTTEWLVNGTGSWIGNSASAARHIDGYMVEFNTIDGQALDPSSFGETDAATGVWKPKAYTGTYGTNGFYLKFADNSGTTSTTLGKDSSGNANNWTPNNFSVTAGSGNDSLVDTPTNYGTDTGAGGEVRGNYATLNPLAKSSVGTLDNGNLQWTSGNSGGGTAGNGTRASIGMNVGKWYTEVTRLDTVFWSYPGISNESHLTSIYNGGDANSWSIDASGQKVTNNSSSAYGSASWAANDIINIAYDADNGELYFGKNGTWLNSGNPATRTNPAFTSLSGTLFFTVGYSANSASASSVVFNFGQRPFAYTAPSGFKALCTQNLPTPTIGATSTTQAGKYFNSVLLSGNGSAGSITGVGFQPDFIWAKNRTNAYSHELWDAIRGVNSTLFSNSTAAEDTTANRLVSFNSDGFSYGTSSNLYVNATNSVAWNWKANGAGSSNTAGSITSTVSANTTSGFSIVTYTGNGTAGATVGHGLGVAPSMMIFHRRNTGGTDWIIYHASLGATKNLAFDTAAAITSSTRFNDTAPTSSVFTVGTTVAVNGSADTYVAYCFAAVAGYSAFGSYTGNGSADGPFVYTNFRPRFVLIKRTDSTQNWPIVDTARDTYNIANKRLFANLSDAEDTGIPNYLDLLSNGFKCRDSNVSYNASGGTYIYMAIAENPFKYSLGR